jgi:Zn-dependent peptidase ImmA (M78 family)
VRRGFKALAERQAEGVRQRMGLAAGDPAHPVDIAQHLNVDVHAADDLVDRQRLKDLQRIQRDAFSAVTFRLRSGRTVVVYNPLSEVGRRNSDLAHELAHIILEHPTRTVERVGGWNFFTCDADEEEEANWLAGCLLLPRPLLLREARRGITVTDLAEKYEVSEKMASFRLNASGVLLQVRRART